METKYNKADLLQFPNWVMDQWRFPNEDYILIPSSNFHDLELRRVIHFLEAENFVTEKGESVSDFLLYFNPKVYDIIISPKQKTFITQAVKLEGEKRNFPKVSLDPEEFKAMSTLYSFNPFDSDHLADWLKQERGVIFLERTEFKKV